MLPTNAVNNYAHSEEDADEIGGKPTSRTETLKKYSSRTMGRLFAIIIERDPEMERALQEKLDSRGWTEIDSEELIDNIEIWRLGLPLTEEEISSIPPGMTERVYGRIISRIEEIEQPSAGPDAQEEA